ncbi:hypothetical protein EVAR_21621_1 [Eumeta japonica]|uniref:Uncharacterized protein n=1 Tax=Eumeta variegata TaxID=151549 RepID=A0A4C1UXF2_EUMVA|nr:hypothetical protein EVAR_21621_1 [Eumeta japonica]
MGSLIKTYNSKQKNAAIKAFDVIITTHSSIVGNTDKVVEFTRTARARPPEAPARSPRPKPASSAADFMGTLDTNNFYSLPEPTFHNRYVTEGVCGESTSERFDVVAIITHVHVPRQSLVKTVSAPPLTNN